MEKQALFFPDEIRDGLFTLHHNPQHYLMQKAVFPLFLALNADWARINSFNGKSIYATLTKDTTERPWAGTKHDSAIASHTAENPRLLQPRATTISLLWSRVSPLPHKAPQQCGSHKPLHTFIFQTSQREKSRQPEPQPREKLSSTPKLSSLGLCIFVVIHVHCRTAPSTLLGQYLLRLLPFSIHS